MITLNQAYKLYYLVHNTFNNQMKGTFLYIENGKKFSYERKLNKHFVTIENELKDNSFLRDITNKGLHNECNMMPNIDEVICFLHEVGHFYNEITEGISEQGYKEYKKATYYSCEQAQKAYRQIPAENIADMFAINFINENIKTIWSIMNPTMNDSEIDDWIECFK